MKCSYRNCNKRFKARGCKLYCSATCADREVSRRWKLKVKLEVFSLYGSRCCQCGFCDVRALQLDHIKGHPDRQRGSYGRGSTGLYVRILKGKIPASSFQLMCANCNSIKRFVNGEGAESPRRKMRQNRLKTRRLAKQKAKGNSCPKSTAVVEGHAIK